MPTAPCLLSDDITTQDQDEQPRPTVYCDADLLGDPGADLTTTNPLERYELKTLLGEGGMGEVLLYRDRRLGREVAMKRVVSSNSHRKSNLEQRFLREARVQGQLEHPAIVPVYDLAKDDAGSAFFTMRCVRGDTLASILHTLSQSAPPPSATDELTVRAPASPFTLHTLLAAFSRVCLAIHFAHTRGVIHRDLKPSNIMFGDFGEVYVLDWGVAKIDVTPLEDGDEDLLDPGRSGERIALHPQNVGTRDGAVLGTPGYMAPEQLFGGEVDHRVDIYALGAILFEILTLEPLHPKPHETLQMGTVERRPSVRANKRNIPPELEAICLRATEPRPEDRFASARELADGVEQFLSGDRDLATRRELAARHVADAQKWVVKALGRGASLTDRARALEHAGRAIALDPDNARALRLVADLLHAPPTERPREVDEELERVSLSSRRVALVRGTLLYTLAGPLAFTPVWIRLWLESPLLTVISIGAFLVAGATAIATHRRPELTRHAPWVMITSSFATATSAWCFGPLLAVPSFALLNTLCHAIAGRRSQRFTVVICGVLSLLVPVALELANVTPKTFDVVSTSLLVDAPLMRMDGAVALPFMMMINVLLIVFGALGLGRYRDALENAEAKNLMHAWLLRHLVRAPHTTRRPSFTRG